MTAGSIISAVLASVLLVGAVTHIALLWNRYKRLSASLLVILLLIFSYAALNVELLEWQINDITPALSVLLKDLLMFGVLLSLWSMSYAMRQELRSRRLLAWGGVGVLAIIRVMTWQQTRPECSESKSGYIIKPCLLDHWNYALVDVFCLLFVAAVGVQMLVTLWRLSKKDSAYNRTLRVLSFAIGFMAAWSCVAAIGALEVLILGELQKEQYVLRPVLSILGGVVLMIAMFIMPVQAVTSWVFLRRRLEPVLKLLRQKTGGEADFTSDLPVSVMDQLGRMTARETGEKLTSDASMATAERMALWLLGRGSCPCSIPSREPVFVQRRWLLSVAGYIQRG